MSLRTWLLRWILIPLGVVLLRLHALTLRFHVEGEAPVRAHVEAGGRVLLCSWHQRFYGGIIWFRRYAPAIAISLSRDGELIARMVEKLGWTPVRGSSSRGGSAALAGMIEAILGGTVGAHIVDGPRGPARRLKLGLVRIAQRARAPIVCVYVAYARPWEARSWDRFQVPLPFTRVLIRFGRMIEVPETPEPDAFEKLNVDLEGEFEREYARVDADVRH
jgi:lysophospholipid acyltransferase (LPLAT)-like uncharacterized protein